MPAVRLPVIMSIRWGLGACLLVVMTASGAGAGGCSEADCATLGECAAPPSSVDAGSNADGESSRTYPEVPPPPGCDPTADPKDALSCLDDAYALFVDAIGGSNSGRGSKAAPLRSIDAATNVDALAGRSRIYVCGTGSFDESVRLPPNVSLVGGFACNSWTYSGEVPRIAPSRPEIALRLSGSAKGVVVSDLQIVAARAEGDGASSVAVLVASSKATLRRVAAMAGEGAAGLRPTTSTNHDASVSLTGNPGDSAPGGTRTCACAKRGSSTGGKGGGLGGNGAEGSLDPFRAGYGGTAGTGGASCTAGGRGGNGAAGGAGGRRAAVLGALTAEGWTPGRGGDGTTGDPGGGGGGGGGTSTKCGGGGACGGCGGSGGAGAPGGGGSIALALFESDVTLVGGTFRSSQAGDGGQGGNGEDGASGGFGGSGGCQGGDGGHGAGGGAGAGGAGGVSAPVLTFGGRLEQGDAQLLPGGGGARGAPGSPGKSPAGAAAAGGAGEEGLELLVVPQGIVRL